MPERPRPGGLHGLITRNVESLMKTRGLRTQRDLAKTLGWGDDRVSRKFSAGWNIGDLPILAEKLEVEANDLISTSPSWVDDYELQEYDQAPGATRDNSFREQVAAEVRAHLARRKITGRELARRLAEAQTWASRRLNGIVPFNVDDLERVAEALDMSPMELLANVQPPWDPHRLGAMSNARLLRSPSGGGRAFGGTTPE